MPVITITFIRPAGGIRPVNEIGPTHPGGWVPFGPKFAIGRLVTPERDGNHSGPLWERWKLRDVRNRSLRRPASIDSVQGAILVLVRKERTQS